MLHFFQNLKIWIFGKFLKIFGLDLEKKILQSSMDSFHIYHKWSLVWEGVLHIMTFDLDLYFSRSFGLGLGNRVRSVASIVPDGFFPYLVQMITSMRRCVAFDDLWPWPISSRSGDLDLENHVRSVASTVLDGFLLYLAQIITVIRGCVVCYAFFKIWKFEFLANF